MKLAPLVIVFLTPADSPLAAAKRGDVTFTVTARGELQGAPMTGGSDMILTYLRTLWGSGEKAVKLALLIMVFVASGAGPQAAPVSRPSGIPLTIAKRGDGKSEMLTAPMTGGNDMVLSYLKTPGEVVKKR